jgi:hypothetical protein
VVVAFSPFSFSQDTKKKPLSPYVKSVRDFVDPLVNIKKSKRQEFTVAEFLTLLPPRFSNAKVMIQTSDFRGQWPSRFGGSPEQRQGKGAQWVYRVDRVGEKLAQTLISQRLYDLERKPVIDASTIVRYEYERPKKKWEESIAVNVLPKGIYRVTYQLDLGRVFDETESKPTLAEVMAMTKPPHSHLRIHVRRGPQGPRRHVNLGWTVQANLIDEEWDLQCRHTLSKGALDRSDSIDFVFSLVPFGNRR